MYASYVTVNRISLPALDADLLVSFANTGHTEIDELASDADFRSWWRSAAVPTEVDTGTLTATGLDRLRAVRHSLRTLGLGHNGVDVDVHVDLAVLEALPLRLTIDPVGLRALDETDLAARVTGLLASALVRASARADWGRFKACPGPECAWVFYDRTRNASRRWCQMSECGNRAKVAAFRARTRATN